MYLSYVLGDGNERENRIVLSRNEIKKRMKRVKEAQSGFTTIILVTEEANRQVYDQYVFGVRFMLQNGVRIKWESNDADEQSTNRQ